MEVIWKIFLLSALAPLKKANLNELIGALTSEDTILYGHVE